MLLDHYLKKKMNGKTSKTFNIILNIKVQSNKKYYKKENGKEKGKYTYKIYI